MTPNDTNELQGVDLQNLSSEQVTQIMQLGEVANRLLQNQDFRYAQNAMVQMAMFEIRGSHEKEERKRESLFHRIRAADGMTEILEGWLGDANAVIAAQNEANDPNRARQEYLDQQGFGVNT